MKSICLQCNKEFKKKKNTTGKYCSYLCYWTSLRTKLPWNTGTKGVMKAWNKGRKETRIKVLEKQSVSNLGKHNSPRTEFKKGQFSKEKHPMWKGGVAPEHNIIRSSIESKLWIQSVFARDGYTCQKTGIKGGKLVAHHILNFAQYPELRFAIDNGIALSKDAHKEFHSKYGKKNNTREQLVEFLTASSQEA